jgi:hypothetical protein
MKDVSFKKFDSGCTSLTKLSIETDLAIIVKEQVTISSESKVEKLRRCKEELLKVFGLFNVNVEITFSSKFRLSADQHFMV